MDERDAIAGEPYEANGGQPEAAGAGGPVDVAPASLPEPPSQTAAPVVNGAPQVAVGEPLPAEPVYVHGPPPPAETPAVTGALPSSDPGEKPGLFAPAGTATADPVAVAPAGVATGPPPVVPPAPPPGFLLGSEVAASARLRQPAFEGQLSLLEQQAEVRKKVYMALIVVASVFLAGMIAGAVLGIFV